MTSEPVVPTIVDTRPPIPVKPTETFRPVTQPVKPTSFTTSTRKTLSDEEVDEGPSFLNLVPQKCSNFSPKRAARKNKKAKISELFDFFENKSKTLVTQTVKRQSWPWLVSLSKTTGGHQCDGSLILGGSYVLTSAQCITTDLGSEKKVSGRLNPHAKSSTI